MVQPRSVEGRMLNWQLLAAKGDAIVWFGQCFVQLMHMCALLAKLKLGQSCRFFIYVSYYFY